MDLCDATGIRNWLHIPMFGIILLPGISACTVNVLSDVLVVHTHVDVHCYNNLFLHLDKLCQLSMVVDNN